MSLDDTVSGIGGERLRFVKYKGHAIFVIDFSNCSKKEMLMLLDQVQASVARHAPGSVLVLSRLHGHAHRQERSRPG